MTHFKPQCCKQVFAGTFTGHRCTKLATVERNGKPYCTIHDPERVEARAEVARMKFEAERKQSMQAHLTQAHRVSLFQPMLDLLKEVSANFTRDDDLFDGLLGRIDELIAQAEKEPQA